MLLNIRTIIVGFHSILKRSDREQQFASHRMDFTIKRLFGYVSLQILKRFLFLIKNQITLGSVKICLRYLLIPFRLIWVLLIFLSLLHLAIYSQHIAESFVCFFILSFQSHNESPKIKMLHHMILRFLHGFLHILKRLLELSKLK